MSEPFTKLDTLRPEGEPPERTDLSVSVLESAFEMIVAASIIGFQPQMTPDKVRLRRRELNEARELLGLPVLAEPPS